MGLTHDPWPEIPWWLPPETKEDFLTSLKRSIRRSFEKLDDNGYMYPDHALETMLDRILSGLARNGYRLEDIEKSKCQTS